MKKKTIIILSLIIMIGSLSYGQDTFTYDKTGLNPKYLVVETDSLSKTEVFEKTINWIKETYKNPDEVIKTTIGNEKVRFEGFKDDLICVNSLGMIYCYYALYTIEISFKENKYKFTPLTLEYRIPASQYGAGGMFPIEFNEASSLYNKKGKLRGMYKKVPPAIQALFNDLNKSLNEYLKQEELSVEDDNDDW